MDQRRSPRFRTRFDTLISTGREEGAGVLAEISYGGARIEAADRLPPLGARVTFYVFIVPVSPFALSGRVVRHTGDGFAISYDVFDPETRRLVDDVAALVSAQHVP